eukprot:GHVQ01023326.1.p1 GENE.GHVQ01023326.1~~GHVQ01023326.1.p1  ORF type:complete len:715 (-),score=42.39 GHVQ01023326.1:2719-4557(-)
MTCPQTKIKFMTDGLLLRDSIIDPVLRRYSVLILDEAHERSLRTDILLGLSKLVGNTRTDLKIVIMSATLDVQQLVSFFGNPEVIRIPGRQFPVMNMYLPCPEEDYLEASLITVLQIHMDQMDKPGDILVFLPGQEDIEALQTLLEEKRRLLNSIAKMANMDRSDAKRRRLTHAGSLPNCSREKEISMSAVTMDPEIQIGDRLYRCRWKQRDLLVCPIFSALPFEQQKQVFSRTPPGSRKVILATNIAETSVTIPGVRFVVDCGLSKVRTCNQKTGLEVLEVQEISKASASQRSGRAGREGPGSCYRLYTSKSFGDFQSQTLPEIVRCEFSQVYLELKAMNIEKPEMFPYIDQPSNDSFSNCRMCLTRLGALNSQGDLTDLGHKLAALPMKPLLANLLVESIELECTSEILSIVSMLSTDSIWYHPRSLSGPRLKSYEMSRKKLANSEGDHLTLLNAYLLWDEAADKEAFCKEFYLNNSAMMRAKKIRTQLKDLLVMSLRISSVSMCASANEWIKVQQCLSKGLWLQTARLDPSNKFYITEINRKSAHLHPSSVLFARRPLPAWIIYSEYVQTRRPYFRNVTAVEHDWLRKLVPHWFLVQSGNSLSAPAGNR